MATQAPALPEGPCDAGQAEPSQRRGMRSSSAWQRAQCQQSFCLPCSTNITDSEAPSSQVVGQWKEARQKCSQTLAGTGGGAAGRPALSPRTPTNEQPRSISFPAPDLGPGRLCSSRERSQSRDPWLPALRLGTVPHCSSGRASLSRGYRGQNPGGGGSGKPQGQVPEGCPEGAPEICRGAPRLGQMLVCSHSVNSPG